MKYNIFSKIGQARTETQFANHKGIDLERQNELQNETKNIMLWLIYFYN